MAEIKITNTNFKTEVIESEMPVLVDFWASWCGPCRMLAPVLSELAEEYAGQVKIGKINVDEEPELASQFGIASIPSLMLFKNGIVQKTAIGYMPKSKVEELIK